MAKTKTDEDVGKPVTMQVHPAVKRVLAIVKAERGDVFLGDLVAEMVVEKYGNDPRYRKILKEAGLIE